MKHNFRGQCAVRKLDVQSLGRQELNTNVLKSTLFHRHVLHVPKLVLTHCVGVEPNRPYAMDGTVAQELRRYQVTVE